MIYEFFTSSIGTIMEMFRSGGIITYLITIIGIYGIILSFEKIYKLRKISKVSLPQIIETVNEAMDRGGSLEALRSIGKYQNPISKIISEALKIGYRNNVEVEDAMERVFIVEMGRMTKGINTLKTIVEIAPLLGLIGTVIGIWYTFKAMGVGGNPSIMAEGIYIALITTIAGLTVAIIILPLYSYIKSKIEEEIDKIDIAKKMTNWRTAEIRIKVDSNLDKCVEAFKESNGIIEVKKIHDPNANIWISIHPNMLDKNINSIVREKANTNAEIIESKLRQ
ncbi:MAG: MotA/TolQ/ExbB proton channel family protein [Methanobacterium sp.]|nr:MotA/TolQ/ExbB proton channel family protein [Methanobacterium sp.]